MSIPYLVASGSHAKTTAVWNQLGALATNLTTTYATGGSSFMADCIGTASTTLTAGNFPAFVITKDSAVATYAITPPTNTEHAALKTTGGSKCLFDD